jgi:addiction module RelE/StbE family toxin
MYRIEISSAARKDIKRLSKTAQLELRDTHFPQIVENPYAAEPLLYDLRGLWAYHFAVRTTQYRIVYEIDTKNQVVLLVMVASREKFYEKLRRRLGLP